MASYQQVDVYVLDFASRAPVPDVFVRVYDQEGTVIFTSGTTDVVGRAGFLLYTRTYSLRFYKFQVGFQQPQLIEVLEGPGGAPASNAFQVYADVIARPISPDARLCRASGYFRDITGQAQRNLDIIFAGAFGPFLLDQAGVLPDKRMVRTDSNGYACLDLVRCAKYSVGIEAWEDQLRTVLVPDSPSVNLPDLLFTMVGSVSYAESVPSRLLVGVLVSLTPSVRTSTGILLDGTALDNVTWGVSDPSVVALSSTSSKLEMRGLRSGSVELRAERLDKTIVQIPYSQYVPGSVYQISVG